MSRRPAERRPAGRRGPRGLATRAVVGVLVAIGATGCGTESSGAPVPPDLVDGQALFELRAIGREPGCVTCHSREPDQLMVGPSLAGLSQRAEGRVAGLDGAAYVRQSIVDPAAFLVAGFADEEMPSSFGRSLTEEQIDALVAYLLELS